MRIGLWVLGAAIALAVLLLAQARWDARRIAPPEGVTNIHEFLAWRPQTERLIIVPGAAGPGSGGEHLMATGASRRLASGPSAYIFDRRGRLVDWAFDIGDQPTFDQRWGAQRWLHEGRVLSPPEIHDWLE